MDVNRNSDSSEESSNANEISDTFCKSSDITEHDKTFEDLKKLYTSIVNEHWNFCDSVKSVAENRKVDLNSCTFEGEYVADVHRNLTVLQLVCGKGDRIMLGELWRRGIDLNYCGPYGKTPLNIACLHGHVEFVHELISRGADVNSCDAVDDCDTPLITTAACYQPDLPTASTYLQIGKALLQSGASPNGEDKLGASAICSAVVKSDEDFTKLLLDHDANPNGSSSKYASPLCKALEAECFDNAKLLLKHGCDVNGPCSKTSLGLTPLHISINKNRLDIILALLDKGADPNSFVKSLDESVYLHSSALHFAASAEHLVTLWLLLVKGGDINSQHDLRRDTPLLILSRKGCPEGVKMLLHFGADVECESQMGTTPIWAAVREDHKNILQVLLETCCSIEIPSMEYHMYMPLTPLEVALRLQSWNMALILLNAGANYRASTLNEAIPAPVSLRRQRMMRTRAAYRLPPEDHRALKELRVWTAQPKTLKHLCRATLRSHFTTRLPELLMSLNYPVTLRSYIFMKRQQSLRS